MNLDKTDVCVFIENEAQLQQARELLERYGYHMLLMYPINFSYLWFRISENYWVNTLFKNEQTEITLTELEEILKGEKHEK